MKPNFLFILNDDHGKWALGASNNKTIKTPNLDKLANNGIYFENFFCVSPVCSPARASIITGTIPSCHGVHDWIRGGSFSKEQLGKTKLEENATKYEIEAIEYLKESVCYTDYLSQNGYECALCGKWHLGASAIAQKGFSTWRVHAKGGGSYMNPPMIEDGKVVVKEGEYVTKLITDEALNFISHHKENKNDIPFYLSVHYTAPHTPWTRDEHPKRFFDLYEDCMFEDVEKRELHPWQNTFPGLDKEDGREENLRGYYAAISAMDEQVGRLIQSLEENDMIDNTVIIFTSDNGMNLGHHGVWGKGNGTFPMNMYDSSVKVPFILSYSKLPKKGVINESMLSHYDVFPTLLDIANVEYEKTPKMPGESFANLLNNPLIEKGDGVVVFDEYGPVRMIRTKTFKYVHRYPYGPFELYDLVNDPNEDDNLISNEKYKDIVLDMKGQLMNWFDKYSVKEIDGSKLPVYGSGQINSVTKKDKDMFCGEKEKVKRKEF